jgi:hypothetical protein
MRGKKLIVSLLMVCFALTLFAGPAIAQKVLKWVFSAPLPDPPHRNGAEFKASVETAMEKIDYKVGDYKIELVWIDSARAIPPRPPVPMPRRWSAKESSAACRTGTVP